MNTFVRFIYVYREKSTGRAVYVGSAFDPKHRDEQHCKSIGLPFDRELKRRGRDAFTFHLVEALPAPTAWAAEKAAAARENAWMDLEHTYRTEGCFNFARSKCHTSEESREATIAALTAAKRTPEARAHQSETQSAVMKRQLSDPVFSAAHSERMSKQLSAQLKAWQSDPVWSAKRDARSSRVFKKLHAEHYFVTKWKEACRKGGRNSGGKSCHIKVLNSNPAFIEKRVHGRWHVKGWTSKKTGRYHPPKPSPKCELCTVAQHQSENCSKPPCQVSQVERGVLS